MTDEIQKAYNKFTLENMGKAFAEYDIFKAGAQSRDQESPWAPIDEMPEEWRDGENVLYGVAGENRYSQKEKHFHTHAMLLAPPKEKTNAG